MRAHFRIGRTYRCHISNLFLTEKCRYILSIKNHLLFSILVTDRNICIMTCFGDIFITADSFFQKIKCHGPVHCSCSYIDKGQLLCHFFCNCAFSCTCRSVNCNINTHNQMLPSSFLLFDRLCCRICCRPRDLKIIATGHCIQVKHFTCKIQIFYFFGFHCGWLYLFY